MALMRLTVTPTKGDQVSVTVTPKVIVEAERHFKMGMGKLFGAESSMEHMTWVAWKAMQLSGYEVKTFDLWLDGIEQVDVGEVEAAPLLTP
jgi:hypothetical protein